ncbi:MAG: helix-turn-helix domain-containing protein [Bacteroidales bacterium]|nr:helix-turn-helix domain-containing protein [Bacteroidales bacterium]
MAYKVETPERHTYYIRNITCKCCEHLLHLILTQHQYSIIELLPPKIVFEKENFNETEFEKLLIGFGFAILKDKDLIKVEKIKQAVAELIHYSNNVDSIVRKSDYLVERLRMPYQQISRIFSKHEGITLEKYILIQKMIKVKELILQNEYTLSEIAYMMDFSSVHHLSATFKKYCGITVTEFKENPEKFRIVEFF